MGARSHMPFWIIFHIISRNHTQMVPLLPCNKACHFCAHHHCHGTLMMTLSVILWNRKLGGLMDPQAHSTPQQSIIQISKRTQ